MEFMLHFQLEGNQMQIRFSHTRYVPPAFLFRSYTLMSSNLRLFKSTTQQPKTHVELRDKFFIGKGKFQNNSQSV